LGKKNSNFFSLGCLQKTVENRTQSAEVQREIFAFQAASEAFTLGYGFLSPTHLKGESFMFTFFSLAVSVSLRVW
jgi:hypothetical protein